VKDSTKDFERALQERGNERYILRLYTTGMTPGSVCVSGLSGLVES